MLTSSTLVEVEVIKHGDEKAKTEIIEFGTSDLTVIKNSIDSIAKVCNWKKYRVGVKNMWTKWKTV